MLERRGSIVRLLLASASLWGCGAQEALPAPVAKTPPRPAPVATVQPNTPLALPDDLLLAGRWRNPNALLAQLSAWTGVHVALEPWLLAHVAQPRQHVDLDLPVEFFVALDQDAEPPALGWAVSFALSAADDRAVALPAGSSPRDVESPMGLACAEAPSLGPAPLRLVCAASDDSLARLLPHATRALPLAALGEADVALSLHARPLHAAGDRAIRAWVAQWLSEVWGVPPINARFDAQWASVVERLSLELRDLAADLDGSSMQFAVRTRPEGLEFSVLAPAAAGRSALGQLLVGTGTTGLAPVEFWETHATSEDAGFMWAFESTPLARLRPTLATLLGTVLDFRGVPARLQRQARDLVEALPLPRGPIIHASGHFPLPPEAPAPAWPFDLGWQLYSVRGNFAEYQFYAAALVKAFNDPILGPQFGRLLRGGFGREWSPRRITQRRLSGGPELPRGSFCLELMFENSRAEPAAANSREAESEAELSTRGMRQPSLFILVAPDEDGVKLAWGADEKFLVSLVSEHRARAASVTLAGRGGLGSLNERRSLAGGFYTLAAFENFRASTSPGPGRAGATLLAAAPHAGLSPIVYSLSQPSEPRSLLLSANLGRDTLEDLLFLIGQDLARP
jgi:hypothetical protein